MENTLTEKAAANGQPDLEPKNSLAELYGYSDLHMLAINNDVAGIRRARARGAQIGVLNNEQQTPAMTAVEAKRIRAAALLYRMGEKADAHDRFKRTALMTAAADGEVDLICLVAYYLRRQGNKAGIDAQDWQGNTAMHWAAEEGCAFAIKCLRWLGARDDIKNLDGDTPMDLARRYKHLNSIRELERVTPVAPAIHHAEVRKLNLGHRATAAKSDGPRRRRTVGVPLVVAHIGNTLRPCAAPAGTLQVAA
jgi:ankyrin repeat protein